MILALDTSTAITKIWLDNHLTEIETNRDLARDIHKLILDVLTKQNATYSDLTGLAIFRGPGSFTGLRIGITVLNALADSLQIPIVGETGTNWYKQAISRLDNHENDKLVLPFYDSDANISTPTH